MSVDEMQASYRHELSEPPVGFAQIEGSLLKELGRWFGVYGDKLHPDNHFLRLNPVKIFSARGLVRYERTADLVLKSDATPTPAAGDKILKRRAFQFSCSWPNAEA